MPSKAKKGSTQINAAKPQPLSNITNQPSSAISDPRKGQVTSLSQRSTVNGQHAVEIPESESKTGDTTESAGEPTPGPAINRKKQKRREKEAAKKAAEQQSVNGYVSGSSKQNGQSQPAKTGRGPVKGYFTEEPDIVDSSHPTLGDVGSPDDAFYSGDEDDVAYHANAAAAPDSSWLNTSKRKKSTKIKSSNSNPISRTSTALSRPSVTSVSNAALRSAHRMGDKIWNTSTQAERENIKQFWLELGEDERRSLVKVEKEAVLRKMKEQQKHSCSCSVCGRKRTAIEEELEVLYDAYYEELEQFANHNTDLSNAPQIMAPPRSSYRTGAQHIPGSFSSGNRIHEIGEDEEDLDDDEYDEDDEPYSDEEEDEFDDHGLPPGPPDFFQFGNSLTVKDGILTVADDLLKNDGKHFIDMMEQLAERRMQREEEIHYPSSALAHQDVHQGHNHPPIDEDDDYDDEEDDEDYDSQEEDDFEGDEMDSMTEEQRMEEGRRMFQIFAARMFEQRVLTAYREKVAAERQAKLLEELDEESRLDTQREAKKAREAAKKKEKKKQQKMAKEEEKQKKEAEKLAQEAAAREVEERKLEEQRQRKEEQRKKREAERKAAEEERLRKEAEKQRRQQDERERQAEQERKQREAKERERKKREESKKKEREDREIKEREARDRKAKEDQERKMKEEQIRKEKADKEAKERQAQTHANRQQPVALPPGLHPPHRGSQVHSPHFQVATPILPANVPSQIRTRQASQPGLQVQSHGSSPRSQKANTEQSTSPATVVTPQTPAQSIPTKSHVQGPPLHHPQPNAPRSPLNSQGRGQYSFHVNGIPGLGSNVPPVTGPGMMPSMIPPMPMYQGPPMGNPGRYLPTGMQYPPGFGGPRNFPPGQPTQFQSQMPIPGPVQAPPNPVSKPSHSRQTSGSTNEHPTQPAPIARPGPIARPSSTTPDKQKPKPTSPSQEVEQITAQLGSKALLDDSDEPLSSADEVRSNLPPVGAPGSGRVPFSGSFPDTKPDTFGLGNQGWGGFGGGLPSGPSWGAPSGQRQSSGGWSQAPFGAIGAGPPAVQRSHAPRPIAVRLMLVQACRQLSGSGELYHSVQSLLRQVDILKAPAEPPVSMQELLEMCDTEGNAQNGGGSFEVVMDNARGQMVKFTEDNIAPRSSVGDIGSPIPGHSQTSPFAIGGPGFGPPGRTF